MVPGVQFVMTTGTALMLLWSASSWDMLILEVSSVTCTIYQWCANREPTLATDL